MKTTLNQSISEPEIQASRGFLYDNMSSRVFKIEKQEFPFE